MSKCRATLDFECFDTKVPVNIEFYYRSAFASSDSDPGRPAALELHKCTLINPRNKQQRYTSSEGDWLFECVNDAIQNQWGMRDEIVSQAIAFGDLPQRVPVP
jgi:hypothetical protein